MVYLLALVILVTTSALVDIYPNILFCVSPD